MKRGPARIGISIAARPAMRTRTKLGLHRRQRFRYRLESHRPRTFHEHGVPGPDELVELPQGFVDVRSPARRNTGGSVDVAACELSHGKQLVDLQLRGRPADFLVVRRGRPAEPGHVAEGGDWAAG